jgi:hypothetical protein
LNGAPYNERCKTRCKHLNKRAEEVNESADADTFPLPIAEV